MSETNTLVWSGEVSVSCIFRRSGWYLESLPTTIFNGGPGSPVFRVAEASGRRTTYPYARSKAGLLPKGVCFSLFSRLPTPTESMSSHRLQRSVLAARHYQRYYQLRLHHLRRWLTSWGGYVLFHYGNGYNNFGDTYCIFQSALHHE